MHLSTQSFRDMKANDSALKFMDLEFWIVVRIFSCRGKYFDKKEYPPPEQKSDRNSKFQIHTFERRIIGFDVAKRFRR